METLGVVDVGSNTVRLSVVEAFDDGSHCIRHEDKAPLRLAARIGADGALGQAAAEDTARTLHGFARAAEAWGITRWLAVATAAVRAAKDRDAFLHAVTTLTGVPVRLLSGGEEAHLGFLGALQTLRETDGFVVDIGGGSTEITRFAGRRRIGGLSLPLGAVNASQRYALRDRAPEGAVQALYSELNALHAAALARLAADAASSGAAGAGPAPSPAGTATDGASADEEGMVDPPAGPSNTSSANWLLPYPGCTLIGIGGTMRALAKLDRRRRNYPLDITHNYVLDPTEATRLREQLTRLTARERQHLPGMAAQRADLIAAGAAILAWVVSRAQPERIVCSGSGLREGIFYDHALPRPGAAAVPAGVLEDSAAGLERLFRLPAARGARLGALAASLWDTLGPLSSGAAAGRLVPVAARLQRVGSTLSYYNWEHHTFYLLREARLFGVDHRERLLLAAAAAFDGIGRTRERLAPYTAILEPGDERLAARMGVCVALAEAIDRESGGRAGPLEVTALPSTVRIAVADGPPDGFAAAAGPADDFRKCFGRALSVVVADAAGARQTAE